MPSSTRRGRPAPPRGSPRRRTGAGRGRGSVRRARSRGPVESPGRGPRPPRTRGPPAGTPGGSDRASRWRWPGSSGWRRPSCAPPCRRGAPGGRPRVPSGSSARPAGREGRRRTAAVAPRVRRRHRPPGRPTAHRGPPGHGPAARRPPTRRPAGGPTGGSTARAGPASSRGVASPSASTPAARRRRAIDGQEQPAAWPAGHDRVEVGAGRQVVGQGVGRQRHPAEHGGADRAVGPRGQVQAHAPPRLAGSQAGEIDSPRLGAGRSAVQAGRHHRQHGARHGLLCRGVQLGIQRRHRPRSPGQPGHPARSGEVVQPDGESVGVRHVQARDVSRRLRAERLADEPRVSRVVDPGVGRAQQGRAGPQADHQAGGGAGIRRPVRCRARVRASTTRRRIAAADVGVERVIGRVHGAAPAVEPDQPPPHGLGRIGGRQARQRRRGRRTRAPARASSPVARGRGGADRAGRGRRRPRRPGRRGRGDRTGRRGTRAPRRPSRRSRRGSGPGSSTRSRRRRVPSRLRRRPADGRRRGTGPAPERPSSTARGSAAVPAGPRAP